MWCAQAAQALPALVQVGQEVASGKFRDASGGLEARKCPRYVGEVLRLALTCGLDEAAVRAL